MLIEQNNRSGAGTCELEGFNVMRIDNITISLFTLCEVIFRGVAEYLEKKVGVGYY